MEETTFVFRTEKSWNRVWDALYDTAYHFASYGYKAITVWGAKAIEDVRTNLNECGIKYKEI